MRAKLLRFVQVVALALSPCPAIAQVQTNQTFVPLGPSPSAGPKDTVQSNDNVPHGGTVVGAVQALLLNPALGTVFIGGTNGGVWSSTNGGMSWTPLTDKQASLSIASLGLDVTDPTGRTLIAGIGITDNGIYDNFNNGDVIGAGGARTGLLYSNDGGNTWSSLGRTTLHGQSVVGVAARGGTILAATFEELQPTVTTASTGEEFGLYRSVNGGQSFARVTDSSGLPRGPVSALVADPSSPSTFYASVTSPSDPSRTGVYMTTNSGATWTPVFTSATPVSGGTNIIAGATLHLIPKLAAGPNGSVAVALARCVLVQGSCGYELKALYLSQNGGGTWSSLVVPPTSSDQQAETNLVLAIDPTNTSIVYVAGDAASVAPYFTPAFRVQGNAFTSLKGDNESDVHADARALAIDAAGTLWLTGDGGVYMRSNPQSDNGAWTGLNTGGLQVKEAYGVAYDGLSKRFAAAGQDTGVALQSGPGSLFWSAQIGADGTNVSINDTFVDQEGRRRSVMYFSTEGLGFLNRVVFDDKGNPISPNTSGFGAGAPVNCSYTGFSGCSFNTVTFSTPFSAPFVLNRSDPTMIAIAPGYDGTANNVYVGRDTVSGEQAHTATDVRISFASAGSVGNSSTVTALAYGMRANNNMGTPANADALLAGVQVSEQVGQIWFTTNAGVTPLANLPAYSGRSPTSMVFDPSSPSAQLRFFVADSDNLWGTRNQGGSFQQLSLPTGFSRPLSVEFVSNNGVNALLAGGVNTPLSCTTASNGCVISEQQSPIIVASSDADGNLSGFSAFGQGLPNTLVNELVYNPMVDVLAVGTVGRGVFGLFDVTSYFPQATVLQFGLADNNSMPDASFLTDGTALNGTGFSRPLIKYGTGTLTIAGAASYTGGTTIKDGVLALGVGGAGGSILGNVAFCADAGDPSCNAGTGKFLAFNRSDSYTFAGAISGPGQVVQVGSGQTILTAASTYSGPTTVAAGLLSVNGSIASSVSVQAGGALGGNGAVGATTVLAGGALSPGNSVGTLTVNGNLVLSAASLYMVEVQGNAADLVNVAGTAALAGTVGVSYLGGTLVNSYTIVSAAAGRTGTFDALTTVNLPSFITTSLAYTATGAQLSLTSSISNVPGLNNNHSAVAAALDNAFNSGAGFLPALFGVPASQLPAALHMLSGEGVSGTQETAFGAGDMFTSIMMDQGAFWRSGESLDVNGVAYGAEPLPYAPSKRSKASTHPAFKAIGTPAPYQPRWRAWLTGFDGTAKLGGEADIGSASLSHGTGGLAGGLDYQFAPDVLLGLAIGGSSSDFSVRDRITSGHLDAAHVGAYGVKTWSSLYLAGALSFSTYRNSTMRTIVGIGPTETASGSFASNLFSGRLELGSRQVLGAFAVTPFAAVQFARLWQNGFTEANPVPADAPGPLGLSYGSLWVSSLPTFLGAQFDARVAFSNGMMLSPYTRVSWVHELNPDRAINAAFIALPTAAFTVDGPRAARDAVRIDAGAKLAVRPNAWLYASFDGEFSDRSQSYAGRGGVRVAW